MLITPKNIWCFKQNKIKYIVQDLLPYVDEEIIREVLLARGVNKWLACRKDLIRLKNNLKKEITNQIELIRQAKKEKNELLRQRLVGQWEKMVEIRERIRNICHSDRWRFPE